MKKSIRIFWIAFLSGVGLVVLMFLLVMTGVFGKLPTLKQLENPTILQSSEVFAADGTLMGKYYREHGNRSSVNYRDISKHVINALIAKLLDENDNPQHNYSREELIALLDQHLAQRTST